MLDSGAYRPYKEGMNKLSPADRARALHMLCEGNSIRAVTRLTGFSKTTVSKLAADAGQAAAWYQDRVFVNLDCKRIQVDEIWGFVGAKQKNVPRPRAMLMATHGSGSRRMPTPSSFRHGSLAGATASMRAPSLRT